MEKSISSLVMVLKRRSWPALATFVAVIGGAVAYLVFAPSLYRASAKLILDDKRVSVSELGRDLTQVPAGVPGGPSPLAEQAELVKSVPILERSLAKVFPVSQSKSKLTTKKFSKGLRVKIVPATNILVISYQTQNPILAANLVNAVSQTMVEESAEQIRKEAANVRKFLEKEVPVARGRLEQAEAAENKYKQATGLISFADQSKSLVDSLATLEDQERTLFTQLQERRSRDASLREITTTQSLGNAYASIRGGQDEQLQKLRTQLADLQTQIATVRLRFTENHPSLILLLQQQQALNALYNRQLASLTSGNRAISQNHVASDPLSQDLTSDLIGNEIESLALENKLKVVQSLKVNLQARLAQLPIQQQPLTVLTRQREEAAASLKLLQSKLEEARIAEAQLVGNMRIIEEAKPPTSPSFPKPPLVLALATVVGGVLAVGVVLLLEATDNTIHDTSEAEEILTKIPMLGTLPSLPHKALNLQAAEGFLDDIALVEPYRMLLKTLEFRSSQKLRSIVISSTKSGEGKSVVVSHLAAVCAMLSRRTLIIDADLHRPMQHKLFNLPAKPGLSEAITKERSLLNAVQLGDIENLSVLTAGELHPRPSQLLESEAMKSLIADATENYDLVIIDTPPLNISADAATLGRYTNGVVLITRPSFTLKDFLKKAVSEFTQNRIPILGVVVNGMAVQTEKSYRYLSRPAIHSTPPRDTVNSGNGSRSK